MNEIAKQELPNSCKECDKKYEVQRKYGKTCHCKLEPTHMDVTHVSGRSIFCPLAGKWRE